MQVLGCSPLLGDEVDLRAIVIAIQAIPANFYRLAAVPVFVKSSSPVPVYICLEALSALDCFSVQATYSHPFLDIAI